MASEGIEVERRSGEDRREHGSICEDCVKDKVNKMSGAASVSRIVMAILLTGALGSGAYTNMIFIEANDANASQNTQISLNSSAIVELRKMVEQNREGIEKITDNQQKQTERILDAIDGIKR